MAFLGHVVSSGGARVPSIYKEVVTSCLDSPMEGVEVVVTTNTHLVEFNQGLVVRSSRLGEGAKFTKVRVLLGQMASEWWYVLEGGGTVMFLRGKSFQVDREYKNVECMEIGDFLNTGKRLVKITLADRELILTDGQTEFDLDQEWPMEINEVGAVGDVLGQRLAMAREAVVRTKAELEKTSKLVDESITELMVSCGVEEAVEMRNVEKLVGGKVKVKVEEKGLVLKGHWVRLVRGFVIFGVELETFGECGEGEVKEVELQLVTDSGVVEYKYYLVKMVKRDERIHMEKVMELGLDGVCVKGTLVAKLPFSSLNPSTSITLLASVSYNLSPNTRKLHTRTTHITLQPKDFCSDSLSPTFTPTRAIPTFLSLYLTGVREILTISTQLGSLLSLPLFLPKLNFTLTLAISGYTLDCPTSPLYLSTIMLNPLNSRQVEAIMYTKDYTHLTLLVRMLREILPADVQFMRVEEALL
eukprot:GFUD01026045.1.p1 GENE.GFUD01026045.1~~GFUD01026045.1.p1  ORF type:complete len:471 (+),score=161.54 GFUD01026045.1:52-1464(+)